MKGVSSCVAPSLRAGSPGLDTARTVGCSAAASPPEAWVSARSASVGHGLWQQSGLRLCCTFTIATRSPDFLLSASSSLFLATVSRELHCALPVAARRLLGRTRNPGLDHGDTVLPGELGDWHGAQVPAESYMVGKPQCTSGCQRLVTCSDVAFHHQFLSIVREATHRLVALIQHLASKGTHSAPALSKALGHRHILHHPSR